MEQYVNLSVDLHLFFLRIMKEHAIFMEAAFQKKDSSFIRTADAYKGEFEKLLLDVVRIGDRAVSREVIESEEIVTPYTLKAEEKTQNLTGIPINRNITLQEQKMRWSEECHEKELRMRVQSLNKRAIELLDGFIGFKEKVLKEVECCHMYTANYPLLLKHIIREAKLYREFLMELETKGTICVEDRKEKYLFWNQIMMEHALFIRGLLDPEENALIETADGFAKDYAKLLEEAREKNDCTMNGLLLKTKELTWKYREFKTAGTKGITDCEISSIILPLLADHVLREANHYLRLLEE